MINYNEHDPPHFHARYGREKISFPPEPWSTCSSDGTFIALSWLRIGNSPGSACP